MAMNIKSERAHQLAREAAQVTGLSQTRAVERGLELLLAQHGSGPAAERARRLDVIRSISVAWQPDAPREGEIAEVEDLYDAETGLPA